jgi:hypothetical protein
MKCGKIRNWLKTIFKPQYQLTLSEIIKSKIPYKTRYIFKEYGSHEYISLTFEDIEINDKLKYIINPNNLMDINLYEFKLRNEYETYHIIEESRGNRYKLQSMSEEIIFSGEYIYENIDIFNNIDTPDLCKIIYTTGFNKGRKVSLALKTMVKSENTKEEIISTDNIIVFKIP